MITWLFVLLAVAAAGALGWREWRGWQVLRVDARLERLEWEANSALRKADPEFAAFLLGDKPNDARQLLFRQMEQAQAQSLADLARARQAYIPPPGLNLGPQSGQSPQHVYAAAFFAGSDNWRSQLPYRNEPASLSAILGGGVLGGIWKVF